MTVIPLFKKVNTSLPLPAVDSPDYEGYLLQVNFVHQEGRRMHRLGAFLLWKCAGGVPLSADELLLWCPEPGCLGVIEPSYRTSPEDEERIERVRELYQNEDPGADIDASLWPLDIQNKINNHWNTIVPCPMCNGMYERQQYQSDYNFRHGYDAIAAKMVEIYRGLLHSSASILMVRHKQDMMYHKVRDMLSDRHTFNRNQYEKLLSEARDKDQTVIYRMPQIHKDASSGKELLDCFKAFLHA